MTAAVVFLLWVNAYGLFCHVNHPMWFKIWLFFTSALGTLTLAGFLFLGSSP